MVLLVCGLSESDMRTLLVLAEHPGLAEALRSALNPEQYRVLLRSGIEEAEPLLANGLVDACIAEMDVTGAPAVWFVEKFRRREPRRPLILAAGSISPEWEEEAYLRGASQIVTKPIRPRMLAAMLDRLQETTVRLQPPTAVPRVALEPKSPPALDHGTAPLVAGANSLAVLRDFSAILSHSLNAEAMLKQFLLLLREILSINRAAVFLRQPGASFGMGAEPVSGRRMRAACAIGLPPGLLEHFDLSVEAGIGGYLFRLGRILRRNGEEARNDADAQKEFELLGAQVAVPILDRETVMGAAVFDARITGEALTNAELELIFHLLEQLALAIKNIGLHDQLVANHELMAQILRELSSACVVVNRDLLILHANKAARKFFPQADRRNDRLEFSDIPQLLGGKVYQVLKTGAAIPNFKYEPESSPGTLFNVNIVPFQRLASGLPSSALMMIEDLTQAEQLRRLEIEAASLRLTRSMADRLAHEVGNAMVPLSTHQQLLADKYKDPEFRASLDAALAEGVKRVTRLINQMRFLARETSPASEAFPLAPLIEEAFEEARKYQPVKTAQLKCDAGPKPIVLTGDRAALKHALAEVLLNALQANPSDPKIGVRLHADSNGNGHAGLEIEVQDNGAGFTPEALQKAAAPFFTTRNVGLGLGLTVTRKIIERHHGKLELLSTPSGKSGLVRISLPLDAGSGHS